MDGPKYFKDYSWKNGTPHGIHIVDPLVHTTSYKIVADPYFKRISIEKYSYGQLSTIIYDSILLDFRHLKKAEHNAWQKIIISESEEKSISLIRNQDDRVLFQETYLFEKGLCKECYVHSAHGILLSIHRMFYTANNDPFNGVILFDQNNHPIMSKKYEITPSGEFTTLLSEHWTVDSDRGTLSPCTPCQRA